MEFVTRAIILGKRLHSERDQLRAELATYDWKAAWAQMDKQWPATLAGLIPASYLLSRHLPGKTALFSGSKLYTYAGFRYSPDSVFDDTVLTYGTDYLLAMIMSVLFVRICQVQTTNPRFQTAAAFLVGGFAVSTLMGGICHHLLPQQIHTWYWRLCWRMCVGAVAASGGALGVCGSELMQPRVLKAPTYVWVAYGAFYLGVTWLGFFSMKNPACDLFLTGVSQSIPTLYVAVALVTREYSSPKHRSMAKFLLAGLLCNIALLPGYDVLNYLGARDGINNIFLHTFLCISWSCQGVAFRFFVESDGVVGDVSHIKNA